MKEFTPIYSFRPLHEVQHRLQELILYICDVCRNDPNFGAVKLNKILSRADFTYFLQAGHSITGGAYKKLDFGPVPEQLVQVRRMMIDNGELFLKGDYYGSPKQIPVAKRRARLNIFTGDEIAVLDKAIIDLREYNAREVSTISHDIKYHLTELNALIPYQFAYIDESPVSELEEEWIAELNQQRKWE